MKARTAIVTITSGRDGHLHRQRVGIAADPPDLHVIVGMGELPHVADTGAPVPTMLALPTTDRGLPLAAARNAGAEVALRAGADVLVFLDVDCIPGPDLISSYRRAAATTGTPSLLCGPVGYLPPPPEGGYPLAGLDRCAPLHPGRPTPSAGEILPDTRFELFWSLSFSVTSATWAALGGFDEAFVGYGAEDTDFALEAAARGATLHWVGGAEAYHQHHPPSRDDPRRVAEMVRNANLFFARRGFWPMRAWFDDLEERGMVDFDAGRASLRPVAAGTGGEVGRRRPGGETGGLLPRRRPGVHPRP